MPKIAKAPQFDNLDDVVSKFKNTICYYKGKSVIVKGVSFQQDPNTGALIPSKFQLIVAAFNDHAKTIKLEDPQFNYKDYNIGYANTNLTAVWWFRRPIKQYQQGLKRDQLSYVSADPYHEVEENFGFKSPFIAMLENEYPAMAAIDKLLKNHDAKTVAFHRDFALSWDNLHENSVLEYRGKKVGVAINGNLDEYRLLPEFKHLAEALQEALA